MLRRPCVLGRLARPRRVEIAPQHVGALDGQPRWVASIGALLDAGKLVTLFQRHNGQWLIAGDTWNSDAPPPAAVARLSLELDGTTHDGIVWGYEDPIPAAEAIRQGQIVAVEVRPLALGKDKLRVRRFPQQEVAEPLVAAVADQQVHVAR